VPEAFLEVGRSQAVQGAVAVVAAEVVEGVTGAQVPRDPLHGAVAVDGAAINVEEGVREVLMDDVNEGPSVQCKQLVVTEVYLHFHLRVEGT